MSLGGIPSTHASTSSATPTSHSARSGGSLAPAPPPSPPWIPSKTSHALLTSSNLSSTRARSPHASPLAWFRQLYTSAVWCAAYLCPSPLRSGCDTAFRSARAAESSRAIDATSVKCDHPGDTTACGTGRSSSPARCSPRTCGKSSRSPRSCRTSRGRPAHARLNSLNSSAPAAPSNGDLGAGPTPSVAARAARSHARVTRTHNWMRYRRYLGPVGHSGSWCRVCVSTAGGRKGAGRVPDVRGGFRVGRRGDVCGVRCSVCAMFVGVDAHLRWSMPPRGLA